MAIQVVEFLNRGSKIRKVFAYCHKKTKSKHACLLVTQECMYDSAVPEHIDSAWELAPTKF